MAAVALREVHAPDNRATALSRGEVISRYRRLREISKQHHSGAMDFLSPDAILHHARGLGVARGKTLVLGDMDEMVFVFDLAIFTAPPSRSRAIDRYAKSARLAAGSDEALVLEAMRDARFALVSVDRRHDAAGVIVTDLIRGTEHWLVDEGLESSLPDGSMLATRLYTPDSFSMTAGVVVPFDLELMEDLLCEVPQIGRKQLRAAIDDRRFAEAVYRVAIADGIMDRVVLKDPE